jgi:hypothetical protein
MSKISPLQEYLKCSGILQLKCAGDRIQSLVHARQALYTLIPNERNLIKVSPQFDNKPKNIQDIAWNFFKLPNYKRQIWFTMLRRLSYLSSLSLSL